jgi:hypothetical protein
VSVNFLTAIFTLTTKNQWFYPASGLPRAYFHPENIIAKLDAIYPQ